MDQLQSGTVYIMPGLQLSNLSAERQAVLLDETVVIGANTASDLTLEKGHDFTSLQRILYSTHILF